MARAEKAVAENVEVVDTEQPKKVEKATDKVYNFTSVNKYLSCAGLGVQFIDGKASTDRLEVARELAKLDGVELVKE